MKRILCLFVALFMLFPLVACQKKAPVVSKEHIDDYERITKDTDNDPGEAPTVETVLTGKTIVCMGDSLFGLHRDETSTPSVISAETGATVYNVGFGGTRISYHPYLGYQAYSGYCLADAVTTGDWTMQDQQLANALEEGEDYFADHLATLKSIDFSTVDILVLHYGTNDFNGKYVPFTDPEDPMSTNTICGALNYTINKFKTAYPALEIIVSLPVYRIWDYSTSEPIYGEVRTDSFGNTLVDLIAAMKAIAESNSVKTINAYEGLGINKDNASRYTDDGTHFNETGRSLFGKYIADCLITFHTEASAPAPERDITDTTVTPTEG